METNYEISPITVEEKEVSVLVSSEVKNNSNIDEERIEELEDLESSNVANDTHHPVTLISNLGTSKGKRI